MPNQFCIKELIIFLGIAESSPLDLEHILEANRIVKQSKTKYPTNYQNKNTNSGSNISKRNVAG